LRLLYLQWRLGGGLDDDSNLVGGYWNQRRGFLA